MPPSLLQGERKSTMDIESSQPRSTHSKLSRFHIKFLQYTPVVNYVYNLFFDEAPDVDDVKETLNLFALITTLFIGGAYGLIGSVTYDELHSIDEMWTNKTYVVGYVNPGSYDDGNIYADMWYSNDQVWSSYGSEFPSTKFNRNISISSTLLIACILCILFVYSALLATDYRTNSQRWNIISFKKSWASLRYAMMIILSTMISGILFSCFAFNDLVIIKVPNSCPYVPTRRVSNLDLCTTQYNTQNSTIVFTLTLISIFILLWRSFIDYCDYKRVSSNEEHQDGYNLQIYQMLKSVVITNTGDAFDSQYESNLLRGYYLSMTDNCIDYQTFLDLSDEELLKLGVNVMGHRKMILARTKKLKQGSKSMF